MATMTKRTPASESARQAWEWEAIRQADEAEARGQCSRLIDKRKSDGT